MRSNRLSVFSELSEIEKLLETKNDDSIKEMKDNLKTFFEKMDIIPMHQTT